MASKNPRMGSPGQIHTLIPHEGWRSPVGDLNNHASICPAACPNAAGPPVTRLRSQGDPAAVEQRKRNASFEPARNPHRDTGRTTRWHHGELTVRKDGLNSTRGGPLQHRRSRRFVSDFLLALVFRPGMPSRTRRQHLGRPDWSIGGPHAKNVAEQLG